MIGINGFPGYYIDEDGAVYSVLRNFKELSQERMKLGYRRVGLATKDGRRKVLVHVLVASAFVPKPDGATEVNHIDGNKENNCAWNLEWVTRSENISHAFANGLCRPQKGESNPIAKLTEESVRKIKQALKSPHRGIVRALAREYGVTPEAVSAIRHGKNWAHV